MSNPHCQAFADAYGEAEDAGRTPMNWQEFLDTRSLGPDEDEAVLRLLNMDSVVVFQRQRRERHLSVQRRASAEPSPAEQMASFAAEMLQPSAGDGVLAAHQQVLDAHQQALARRFPRALGRQELKAIRRGVEATLPAAPAASDLVAPYDLTPGREYNAPPMDDY
jgi:hypothetical protein